MDRKKELQRQYKEMKTEAGVYQIRNTANQKIWVESTPNLRTLNGKLFMLKTGGFPNKALQEDWKQFGEESFVIEILETLKKKEDGYFDLKYELEKLEQKWLDQLQPYGERGYNKPKAER
ncbi:MULTISPECIES: GIY-YIG nuclease family protein [unclassified Paenibacillus]|uniref:GIY-YIG nuclease family protein n=1 Tax=unclassified Paenibacillus TaxID=185978 RepID=UPI001C10AF8A|nr:MULTISPECIES: GIY-YIG nuclease family protein [unclassified Paenibacillus]MBU5444410.1 GIY-YIG nuclease family protein [Paenibacillus sp. MSJ-34]CAH0120163.1 hypothetical protein PAE9249_02676 [Paenibacillus sp. CECT 9249]